MADRPKTANQRGALPQELGEPVSVSLSKGTPSSAVTLPNRDSAGWWLRLPGRAPVRSRLFCLPYAGGAASVFRLWPAALPPTVEVWALQLPGRGSRFREAPCSSLSAMVERIADALRGELDLPYALFGHSMGAVVAFELARELRRRRAPGPRLLVVSGHQAPQLPDPDPPFSHLDDAAFLREVQERYDGIPPEVAAEAELLELLLPVLRADVKALEAYAFAPGEPLDCAFSCFGGETDRHVTRADLEAWGEHSVAGARVRTFAGGHFFVESARDDVLRALSADLQERVGA